MDPSDEVVEELRAALAPELVLLERLGSGGMGDVFLARDPALKRTVAVKVLASHLGLSADARRRFAREAEAAAAVAHPNVVPIHRVGTLPRSGFGYIVMAHVDGPPLRELIPEGTVASESEVRRIVAEVASALVAAHAKGVVHRDIKPANVLFDPLGDRFVVVDFGVAAVRGPHSDRLTQAGVPIGTPAYMSPEQAAGDPVVDKSDVYSLGCLAYELLAGSPPITGPSAAAVVRGHLHQQPKPIASLRSDLSADFAGLVMRCLRKDPAERPTPEEITRALGFVRRTTIEWPPPGLEALHRQGSRWLRTAGGFALTLFAFVLILGIHPAAARPCCADSPDRSPGWILLRRLSMLTPIHFDDPDALAIWYFLLDAAFFVLLAALVPLTIRTIDLVRKLGQGRRAGYPLSVLVRVAGDRHRDTDALINLTGPYALVPAEEQQRQLRRRAVATGAIGVTILALVAGCLAWLGGVLHTDRAGSSGLLPFAELLLLSVPAALGLVVFLLLEGLDFGRRWRRTARREPRRPPLRADVLRAWIRAAGVAPVQGRWSGLGTRLLAALALGVGVVTVGAAAYGLIAVFGASARFASARAGAVQWLHRLDQTADSTPPPLESIAALALTADIPVEGRVERALLSGRMTPADRRLVLESVGPGFCLNPREVLFGLAPERLAERIHVARLIGADPATAAAGFDSVATGLEGGGLLALRRRARYCEQLFGAQASISTQPRPRGGP